MGKPTRECDSHVCEKESELAGSKVPRDTRNPVGSRGDHPPSLNTTQWPIAKSTVKERWKEPREGSEKNLKPYAYKHREPIKGWSGTFCRMVRRVNVTGKVKHLRCGAEGKPSLKRAHIVSIRRPETGWSTHVQVEVAVKGNGGPNAHPLKRVAMRCG